MVLSKTKKTFLIIISVIIILAVLIILFISPITKYMVEKYDEKFTGRQITMDWAYVNPFTGSIYFNDLRIYEYKSDSTFLSFEGFSVNVSIIQLVSKHYKITSVTLDNPTVYIIKNKKDFNFNDLIQKFSSKDTAIREVVKKAPTEYEIEDIKIINGELHYIETQTPVNYFVRKFYFETPGVFWNSDTLNAKFSFESGMGSGDLKGNFTINTKNKDYQLATVIRKFDLKIIEQYMKDLTNYGKLSATLDADIKAKGNFKDAENINLKGLIAINDFHFGKTEGDDYTSFEKLVVDIKDLSPGNKVYLFDSIMLLRPYFKYEKYDSLDNLQQMFGKKGKKVKAVKDNPEKFNLVLEIADYIKTLSKNFLNSYYKVNKLGIHKAEIEYNDFSLPEKFSIGLNPLSIVSDSIDKNNKRFSVSLKTGIKPHGNMSILLSMNPKSEGDFDLDYHFQKIPASLFNPYLISYTSFPLDRGSIDINGNWRVRNRVIQSNNQILVIDPRVTKRIKTEDTKWIPTPLIMAFVREQGNVIDYQVPISGNLNDPKFHFRDIIFDLIKNIFVKPVTTPYRFQVKNIEQQVEKSLTLKWAMRKTTLIPSQQEFSEKIATFLKDNPEASITIQPITYAEKEKEYILLFEAKKKYFLTVHHKTGQSLSEDDSVIVDKMSSKDAGFVKYLEDHLKDSLSFTVQQKAYRFIGDDIIVKKYHQLLTERKNVFMQYFKDDIKNRVSIQKNEESIPFNGFSAYKISYHGDMPESLRKAYEKLHDLNEEDPRKQYKKERKKIFGIL